MKKLKVYLFLILSVFLVTTVSCEKDYLQISESQSQPLESSEITDLQQEVYNPNAKVLSFASSTEYTSTLKELFDIEAEEIKNHAKLKEFYSLNDYNISKKEKFTRNLRTTGSNGTEVGISEVDDEDEIIFDSKLAAVLNENREVQIEGVTYRIVKDGLFAYKNTDNKTLDNFLAAYSEDRLKRSEEGYIRVNDNAAFFPEDLFYDPIENESKGNARVVCTSSGAGFFGHNHTCVDQYNGNFRVKGRTYSQSFGIFASLGTSTRHQRKLFGIWTANSANFIYRQMNTFQVEFEEANNVITTVDFATFPQISTESKNNDNKVKWSDDFQTGVFTTKFPFLKKPAKARKIKKHDTLHRASRSGLTGEVQLKYN